MPPSAEKRVKMDFQKWITRIGSEIIPLEVNCFQTGNNSGYYGTIKHVHPGHLHIACFEKGSGICMVNGISHKIRPGDIFLICPGEMHQFTPNQENPYLACFLHFSWFGELPSELPQKLKVPLRERRKFFQLCRQLSEDIRIREQVPGGEYFFHGRLLCFWGMLHVFASGSSHHVILREGINKVLNPVIEKLHGPPFFYPGIDTLADECGLSRRQLTKLFRRHVGCSIKQYYLANVMHYASTIRQQKSMKIAELAQACGYSTTQNFLLAYKKYFSTHSLETSGKIQIWSGSK